MVVQIIARIVYDIHAIGPFENAPLIKSLLFSFHGHYVACLLPRPQLFEPNAILALLR